MKQKIRLIKRADIVDKMQCNHKVLNQIFHLKNQSECWPKVLKSQFALHFPYIAFQILKDLHCSLVFVQQMFSILIMLKIGEVTWSKND